MGSRPSFIDIHDNTLPPDLCKEIIRRFEEDEENQFQGVVGDGIGHVTVDMDKKLCTELSLSHLDHWKDIDALVYKAVATGLQEILDKYEGLEYTLGNSVVADEGYRIKRYFPGEFFKFHVDCGGWSQMHRQLVLFTFLNTVEEGGQLEFPEHGISVTPVEGRMVTFPPFWTHAHVAHPPVSGTKYALQAWVTFVKPA